MTTLTDDPWVGLDPPPTAPQVSARRVDSQLPWDFFWARDPEGSYLLLFRHAKASRPKAPLPRLRGIGLKTTAEVDPDQQTLIWSLEDSSQKDIFQRLCRDIVESTSTATTELEAASIAIARTWRWHRLLRRGSDELLTNEEQKGLIGELLFLERYLLPVLRPSDALTAWRGPLGSPKDFEVGRVAIEAKARRGAAEPFVAISSEFQLDTTGTDTLYLYVVEIGAAPEGAQAAFSVATVAARVRDSLNTPDGQALESLESLLEEVGFRWTDDYADTLWIEGPARFFEVGAGFPRIAASAIPPGISRVRYSIALSECVPFGVEDEVVRSALKEAATHAD